MSHICGRKMCVTLSKTEELEGREPRIPCDRCGFNPKEQERREKLGKVVETGTMVIDHAFLEDSRQDKEIITGLRTLVFPKKVSR